MRAKRMIVGLDIHKEMSYATLTNDSGCILERKKAPSTYDGICTLLDGVPRGSEIALEATSPALSIYSQLEAMGYKPHRANPRKVKVIAESKLKSDKADSEALARLLMMNWLPEAYVPDEHIQKFRELTRTRRSFKSMETKCKNSIHAELIRNRIVIEKPFTLAGMRELERPGNWKIDLFLKEMENIRTTIRELDSKIEKEAQSTKQCGLLMSIPGIGSYSALLIYPETGDSSRFPSSNKLCVYAGLVPSTWQSYDTVYHGRITKQGSKLLRWILIECTHVHMKTAPHSTVSNFYRHPVKGKGKKRATVAAAAKLLNVIYWVLREGREYRGNWIIHSQGQASFFTLNGQAS